MAITQTELLRFVRRVAQDGAGLLVQGAHPGGSHAMKRCTCCGRFLPKSWSHETIDDEDDKRRYTRVIWYVLCICGTMNTEDA